MDKGFGNVIEVLTVWVVGDVFGLVVKIFMSILGTVLMPFLLLEGLFTPDN